MTFCETTYETLDAARVALSDACMQGTAQGRRPVVLLESMARVHEERRLLSQANMGFGVEVSVLRLWVESLWALFGDGRMLVDSTLRLVLAAKVLARSSGPLPKTPGMLDLLCRAAQEASPYLGQTAQLTGNEIHFVALLKDYLLELENYNLCEYGQALNYLATHEALDQYRVVVFDILPGTYSAVELDFLKSAGAEFIAADLRADKTEGRSAEIDQLLSLLYKRGKNDAAVQAQGALKCAFSAGPSAEHRIILDCIESCFRDNANAKVFVAVPDPLATCEFCAQPLQAQQIDVGLTAYKPYAETDFGRALAELTELVFEDEVDKLEAADFAYNPFSGIYYGSAFRVDVVHRGDRLLGKDEVLSGLAGNAEPELQGFIPLFEEEDYQAAFSMLETYINQHFSSAAAYRFEQLSALQVARELFEQAQKHEAPLPLLVRSLAQLSSPVQWASQEQFQVEFGSLASLAGKRAATYSHVIIGGLDIVHYPIRSQDDALSTLLSKWGAARDQDVLLRMRTLFFRAITAASDTVILQRSLNDSAAEALQPAAVFEEVMDCYRAKLSAYDDVDKVLGIPKELLPFALQRGEETLVENTNKGSLQQACFEEFSSAGLLTKNAKENLLVSRSYHGKVYPGVDLSASQIESYLECPYQWFAKRRLRIGGIDEGFGSLERGTFVHNVLQFFYERFIAEVGPKVTQDTLPQARELLSAAFREQTIYDRADRRPGNRYVYINSWEEQIHQSLLPLFQKSLEYEVRFLPLFRPAYFEWGYGEELPFAYAGCNLVGRIDRIDVDDAGHAVVVDYKTSLSTDYRLRAQIAEDLPQDENSAPSFVLPRKMQTLIYAKVVQDCLGLQLAGALYFNPLTGEVQGAYDKHLIGPADFPRYKKTDAEANEVPNAELKSFDDLLRKSENAVQERIGELLQGDIEPRPLSVHVCKYCPVGQCSMRQAERAV